MEPWLRERSVLSRSLPKGPGKNIMPIELVTMLQSIAGLIVGGLIGAGFGMIQDAARRRYERLQESGKLKTGWAVMPGSGVRVAYLLVVLALAQVVCPLLFKDGIQWWVSGGVVAGYGWILFRKLRRGTRGV
jgi:uncharacterized BrkB/YihY/UPF0761 family membrane protein